MVLPLVSAILFSGCGQKTTDQRSINLVTVSILPQKYFVERVADTLVEVKVLVPPGSSPETYEPTPVQLKDLNNSLAYFSLGLLDFEKNTLSKLHSQNANVKFVDHSLELNLIEGQCGHNHSHEAEHIHAHDPHVWTSPREVKTMVKSIERNLSELLPEHKSTFSANAEAFIAEIDSLDKKMEESFSDVKSRKIFIFHPAFTYLARDYGLEQVSLEEEGKSPSMKHLKSVLQQAKGEGVKTIFIQKEFDAKTAETIAHDISGRVVVVNPLEANWLENMFYTANLLEEAMNGK
mgnify:CR=1 FL=1